MKSYIIALSLMLSSAAVSVAQNNKIPEDQQAKYLQVITERADKIVAALKLNDAKKVEKVRNTVRDQYSNLNDIYTERDDEVKAIKAKNEGDKAALTAALKDEETKVTAQLDKLHKKYLNKLSSQLTPEQVDGIKNGMTYSVMPLTYKAYQEEILTLTEAQKQQILAWLIEAREHAIDAESADKKHAWFGKYKGRINNYLSTAGYDLKKEGAEWEKRRKSASANK